MKKLLLGLGTVTAIVTPVISIVACGTTSKVGHKDGGKGVDSDTLILNARRMATLVYMANDKVNTLLKNIQSLTQRQINAMNPGGHMSTPSYVDKMRAEEHARQVGLTGGSAAAYIASAGSSHWVQDAPNYALANALTTQISDKKQEANTMIGNFNNLLSETQQMIQNIKNKGVEIPSDLETVEYSPQKSRVF